MPFRFQFFRTLFFAALTTLALSACGGGGGSGDTTTAPGGTDFTLSVNKTGSGTIASNPAGINCGSTCSQSVANGTVVTLTATPTSGYSFAGWGGDCSGTGTCQFTMSADRTVTAAFTANSGGTYALSVTKSGSGTVTSNPTGINCGSSCSQSVADGTVVTLTATPASGYSFAGWGGDCSGTGTCQLTMSADQSVSAIFTANGGGTYALSVSKSGSGTVTSNPTGINCGSTCGASFATGTSVTLTAAAASGYNFDGWSGDCSGTGTCTVTMSAARAVTATFSSAGGGSGIVSVHTFKADASGSGTSPMTTPAVTTTSGSTILVQVLTQNSGTFAGLSDNKGNTYVNIGGAKTYVGGGAASYLYKAENANGGSGHTWSLTKASGYATNEATIFVAVVASSSGVGAYSYNNSGSDSGTPITTTAANSVILSFWGPADYNGTTANYIAPSGWTRLDQATNSANSNSGADAYTSAANSGTTINATWTSNHSIQSGSSMWLVEVKP